MERTTDKLNNAKRHKRRSHRTLFIYGVCWTVGLGMVFHLWGQSVSADSKNQHYIVQSGDTVWSIASNLHSRTDIRDLSDEIVQMNHLGGNPIHPGEVLVVPQD